MRLWTLSCSLSNRKPARASLRVGEDESSAMPTLNVNGIDFYYELHGADNAPVVVLSNTEVFPGADVSKAELLLVFSAYFQL